MLHVLAGRLSEDITVNQTKSGMYVCNTGLYVWPGKKGFGENAVDRDAILVKVEAWGEQAKELAKYGKSDTIQFVGKSIDMKYQPKGLDRELIVMGYEIKKIDHSKTILSEFNKMLYDYVLDNPEKNIEANKAAEKNDMNDMNRAKEKSVASEKPRENASKDKAAAVEKPKEKAQKAMEKPVPRAIKEPSPLVR